MADDYSIEYHKALFGFLYFFLLYITDLPKDVSNNLIQYVDDATTVLNPELIVT